MQVHKGGSKILISWSLQYAIEAPSMIMSSAQFGYA